MEYEKISLNKLYSPNQPCFTDMEEYYNKIRKQLIGKNIRTMNILVYGSAPTWLFIKIMLFLEPFVNSISIQNSTGEILEITSTSEKFNKL